MSLFGFAFAANLVRYAILLTAPSAVPVTFVVGEALHGVFGTLLLAGSFAMVGRRLPSLPFILAWGIEFAYCILAAAFIDDEMLRSLPIYVCVGLATIGSGILFLRRRNRLAGDGYGFAAVILILWGLHKLDYPWAAGSDWAAPAGFVVASILESALSVAIIVIAERSQHRLAEQARADKSLVQEISQRVLHGEGMEVLMPLLCRSSHRTVWSAPGMGRHQGRRRQRDRLGICRPAEFPSAIRRVQVLRLTDVGDSPAGRAMRSGQTERIDTAAPAWNDPLVPLRSSSLTDGLAVPLRVGKTVLGALTVYSAGPISDAGVGRLEALTGRVGIAGYA